MSDDITPRVDIAFKKIFGVEENKDLLISLINSIVSEEDQVIEVTLLNPYNPRNFKKDKLSVLDIKAKNEKGLYYNIEMQISDEADYDKRALYYWAKLYTEQMKKSSDYDVLQKTIGIHILNFLSIPGSKKYHNIFQLREIDTGLHYFKDVELHTIELSKFETGVGLKKDDRDTIISKLKSMLDVWATYFLNDELLKDAKLPKFFAIDIIKKAIEVLKEMNFTSQERENYEEHLKWLRVEAGGIKKAEEKSFAKGIAEGEAKGIERVAINMLKENQTVELVMKVTGLSESVIKKLSEHLDS